MVTCFVLCLHAVYVRMTGREPRCMHAQFNRLHFAVYVRKTGREPRCMHAQFDRLHFAYQKAVSEAAYVRTLVKLLELERQANRERKA